MFAISRHPDGDVSGSPQPWPRSRRPFGLYRKNRLELGARTRPSGPTASL